MATKLCEEKGEKCDKKRRKEIDLMRAFTMHMKLLKDSKCRNKQEAQQAVASGGKIP